MAERWADLAGQLRALASMAGAAGVERIVIRQPATLAWLLGARVHVPQTLDTACLDVVVEPAGTDGPHGLTVVTNAIEAPRLLDTELAGLPASWDVVPWWEPRETRLPTGPRTGSDRPRGSDVDLSAELAAVRRVLTPRQQGLLADVARDAAAAATRAAHRVTPAHDEYAAAGVLADELLGAGLDPVVLMVAGGDRGGRHRHPLPTMAPVGERAMLVCCARRDGLVASVTRFVVFTPLDAADREGYRRLLEVERSFLDESRPGARLGDVVTAGTVAYAAAGLEPEEWHRHHQGGITGWQPREFPAHPGTELRLAAGMAVAWNPNSARWKVEDTALVEDDGPRLLVEDPDWPTLTVGGRRRPDVLDRS